MIEAHVLPKIVANNTNDGSIFLPSLKEFTAYKNYFKDSVKKIQSEYFPGEIDSIFLKKMNLVRKK